MPDGALVLLSVALAAALAAAVLLTLRRSGTVAAATREVAASRRALRDFGARADAALAPILDRIDGVRRRLVEPSSVVEELHDARMRVEELAEEARALELVPAMRAARAAVVEDVERAARALDMIEHGCGLLGGGRARGRELEAQTAIKRGYLNLLHAREALARHAAEGAAAGVSGSPAGVGRTAGS
jgi:hypothetical protein